VTSLAFIVAGAAISALLYGYVWYRLKAMLRPSPRGQRILKAFIVVAYVMVPISTSSRMWAPSLSSLLSWAAGPWMAFVGIAATLFAVLDIVRFALFLKNRVSRSPSVEDAVTRRRFLTTLTGGTAMVSGASVAEGMISARGDHEIVTVEFKLSKLPRELDGFSIVQLSDLNIGMTIDREFVQRVVDRTNALVPDLIALTGDLVDGHVNSLRDDVAPLSELHAPHGIFAVTGNHEYYSGADAWIAELTRMGIRYLRNERVDIGNGGNRFELAGVDDYSAEHWPGHGEDIGRAAAGRDLSRAFVLLAHQPRQVRRAAAHGVDLQLSGHTHGGQIWPWHHTVMRQQGYLAERYQHEATQLYVTRGCGYWGPPVRLFAPLEITRIVLRASDR